MIGYPDDGSSCVLLPPPPCGVCRYSSSAPVSYPPHIPFILSQKHFWAGLRPAITSSHVLFPIIFSSFHYEGERGKVLCFPFPVGANPAVWEYKNCSTRSEPRVTLHGITCPPGRGRAKKSLRKNINARQAFSRQHSLILSQSAVYAVLKLMTVFFIIPTSL